MTTATRQLKFRSEPWAHQRTGLEMMLLAFEAGFPGFALAMDMGTGKTKTAIDAVSNLGCARVLVLCPKSVVPVWPREFAKHGTEGFPVVGITVDGTHKKYEAARAFLADNENRGLIAVNYDSAFREPLSTWIRGVKWDALVLDESHRIKSHGGITSKFCATIPATYTLGLTGTFLPHSPLDAFGQMRTIAPSVFGTSWARFRNRYAILGVRVPPNLPGAWKMALERLPVKKRCLAVELIETQKFRSAFRESLAEQLATWLQRGAITEDPFTAAQWNGLGLGRMEPGRLHKVVDFRNMEEFEAKLSPVMYQVNAEDVLDLPEKFHVIHPVELEPKAQRFYESMERDLVAWMGEETDPVVASNALDKILKLQQVTSGTLKTPEGELKNVSNAKWQALVDILEDLGPEEPVVVFCRFQADLDAVHSAAAKTGRVSVEQSGRRKDIAGVWEEGEPTVLAAQIKAASEGIDLTRARYCVYFSVGYELGVYLQSLKRCHRPGQRHPVKYLHLLVSGSVDEVIHTALQDRKSTIDTVLDGIKQKRTT